MSDTKRKVFTIVVFVLVILFGVGQFFAGANINSASQPATGANSPATQIITASIPSTFPTSTPIEAGSCFSSSIAAPYRADAWRCSVGNAISDPCFEVPDMTGQLICNVTPTAVATTSSLPFILQNTKALPKSETPSSTPSNWAWAVELSDGTICTPFTGTRPFSATGEVATYSCSGPIAGENMIFGDLNNASATWTAEVGALSTETSTFPPPVSVSGTVPLLTVWQ